MAGRSAMAPSRRLLWPAFVVVLVVLAVLGLALAFNLRVARAIEESRALVARAMDEADAVRVTMNVLRDAETGQRGFLLTGKAAYLQPYNRGLARVAPALQHLRDITAQSDRLSEEAAVLVRLVERKMAELESSLRADRERGRSAALEIVQTDFGMATMESAREQAAQMIHDIDAEHSALLKEVRRRENLASAGTAATGILGVLGLSVATLALLGNRARLLRTQAALREQSARLTGTIQNMRDGLAVFGPDGGLRLWNAQFAALARLPAPALRAGASYPSIVQAAWPGMAAVGAAGAAAREVRREREVFEIWSGDMPDGGQIVMVAEITRRTEAEAIARQAQKMESLGQLTGGVAHDFNNLLQVVSANLELLLDRLAHDNWMIARVQAALAAVERAARLTRHLLAFARRQPLAPEAVETRRLLGGLEDMLRRTLGGEITLEMIIAGGLWPIRADAQQLENAVLNLAINARDAMPSGGRLTIEALNTVLDDNYAALETEVSPGQYVLIAVTDTGVGMTQAELTRAIEPFYTTKSEGRGSGLGLPMVFGFAKQSGGHFKLYSEPGHGTTARLYIPRSTVAPASPAPEPEPAQPAHGELVLIVEDDDIVRAASVQAVRGLGYRTLDVASAAAALDVLREGARPDLLFTDIVMPGAPNARVLAEEARRICPGIAVLFTSGYSANAVVHNGQVDPGVRLISKPWRVSELARKLRQSLDDVGAGPARTLRVLIAEDEALVRLTTADMLADLGHDAIAASTGAEALEALANDATIGVLLTDLGLPDVDGIDLARRAVERRPELRIVIASGRAAPDHETPFVWLEKPYDQAALAQALRQAATV